MGLRHSHGKFLAAAFGLLMFASFEASAQQKSTVTFQAVDSIKARDLAALGRHGEFRTKTGPSLMFWETDPRSNREKKDGKVLIGIVIGKLNQTAEAPVMAKVWAADGTMALDRLSSSLSRSGDAATLILGTSADYKTCTDAAASVTATCLANLPYVKLSAAGEFSSSSGKLGAAH